MYSLNRDHSFYNRELSSVSEIVDRRYWPHEIPVLDMEYTQTTPKKAANDPGRDLRMRYRHVIGWRRVDE
jgi:hypothetical protein